MEIFTANDLVKDIASEWKKLHCRRVTPPGGKTLDYWKDISTQVRTDYAYGGKISTRYTSTEKIYERLIALGDNPDPEDVRKIIGKDVATVCQHCYDNITEGITHNDLNWCFDCFDNNFPELSVINNIWE